MRRSRLLASLGSLALVAACGGVLDSAAVEASDRAGDTDAAADAVAPPLADGAPVDAAEADGRVTDAAGDARDASDASTCGVTKGVLCGVGELCSVDEDCASGVCSSVKQSCVAVPPPPPPGTRITKLVAGRNHTCALWSDGVAKCWGSNAYGQLGLGDTIDRGKAKGEMGAALPPIVAMGTGAFTDIAAGGDRTCLRSSSGTTCFGKNDKGQLGNDSKLAVLAPGTAARWPSTAGAGHSCHFTGVLVPSPGFECWGDNAFGQHGAGDTVTRGDDPGEMAMLPFIPLPLPPPISVPDGHGIVTTYYPEPKDPDTDFVTQGSTASHTCVSYRLADFGGNPTYSEQVFFRPPYGRGTGVNQLACWGKNDKGQLGLGDTQHRGDGPGEGPVLVDFGPHPNEQRGYITPATGGAHTCLLLLDRGGTGYLPTAYPRCWGDNSRGQLGVGDTQNRGDQPGEMGNALPSLPPVPVIMMDGINNPWMVLGESHTCLVTKKGTTVRVKCWGANDAGQLGLGDATDRGTVPGQVPGPDIDLGTGKEIDRPSVRRGLVVGANHACALLVDPNANPQPAPIVKCWGKNDLGQLGLGDTNNRGDQPGEMGDALPVLNLR